MPENVAELLREVGGVVGVVTLLSAIFIFYFTKGRSDANKLLLEEQNKLLREDVEDRKRRTDEALDIARKEKQDILDRSKAERSELLNKLSDSVQARLAMAERLSAVEALVTQKAPVESFREFMEGAVKHFQESILEGRGEHAAITATLAKLNEKEERSIKVLEKISDGMAGIVEYLRVHNGDALKGVWEGDERRTRQEKQNLREDQREQRADAREDRRDVREDKRDARDARDS